MTQASNLKRCFAVDQFGKVYAPIVCVHCCNCPSVRGGGWGVQSRTLSRKRDTSLLHGKCILIRSLTTSSPAIPRQEPSSVSARPSPDPIVRGDSHTVFHVQVKFPNMGLTFDTFHRGFCENAGRKRLRTVLEQDSVIHIRHETIQGGLRRALCVASTTHRALCHLEQKETVAAVSQHSLTWL